MPNLANLAIELYKVVSVLTICYKPLNWAQQLQKPVGGYESMEAVNIKILIYAFNFKMISKNIFKIKKFNFLDLEIGLFYI